MKKETLYQIRNWAKYKAALVNRGNLTVWVDEEALQAWQYRGSTQRGAQYVYAEAAIQCVLALRAAQGFTKSVSTLPQVSLTASTFGATLQSRNVAQQATELFLRVSALNRVTQPGIPESYLFAA